MNIKMFSVLLCLVSALLVKAGQPEIFEKKGKYGLIDPTADKVIVKAKYDSIFPFEGRDYTLVMKKGKYGIMTNDGTEYLGCKFSKILFPVFHTDRNGKRFFWVSKNGSAYYRYSNSNYYTAPFYGVFYGPDKVWYGQNSKGLWIQFTDVATTAPACGDRGGEPKFERIDGGYALYNGKLYSPGANMKLIRTGVELAEKFVIGGKEFLKVTLEKDSGMLLIDLASEDVWEKDSPGLKGVYAIKASDSMPYIVIDNNGLYYISPISYDSSKLFIVTIPEQGIKGVISNSKQVLPYRFTNILIDKNAGKYNDEPLWKVTLESQKPIFEDELKEFVAELRNIHSNFVIVDSNSMGKSLFGNTGKEILHNTLDAVYTQNGFLKATADGKEIVVTMEGVTNLGDYDNMWHSKEGNLTIHDFVVQKNGKVGLYVEGKGEVIPPKYEGLRRQWGHIFAFDGDLVALYDDDGKLVVPLKYTDITIANAYEKPNFYLATTKSGAKTIFGDRGQVILPAGQIDSASFSSGEEGKWCPVYKNGRMGIMNLHTGKIAIPCIYEDNIFFGDGKWPNRKIGVYRSTSSGEVIDIWTLGGRKIASRTFSRSQRYTMKLWLENQLNASFYYD